MDYTQLRKRAKKKREQIKALDEITNQFKKGTAAYYIRAYATR